MRRFLLLYGAAAVLYMLVPLSASAYTFTRYLDRGSIGPDVSALQQVLQEQDYFTYPEITDWFGPATQAAVQAFQFAKALATSGTPESTGYGRVGPATLAALNALGATSTAASRPAGATTTVATSTTTYQFTRDLGWGMQGEDVRQLQAYLNAHGFPIAITGAGSRGQETDWFGPATQAALAGWQAAQDIAPPAGFFGPLTRAKIAGLAATSASSSSAEATSTKNGTGSETTGNTGGTSNASSALSAPTNFSTTVSSSQVSLSWNDVPGATSYRVERRSGSDAYTTIATTTSASYTDTAVTGNSAYRYGVTALNNDGESARSAEVAVSIPRSGGGGNSTSYDFDSITLFSNMSVVPSTGRKELINTLILSLKAAGVWSKLDTLYVIAAHDAQAARLNWKGNPSYNLLAINSPAFVTDRGYYTNGASNYLSLNWAPTDGANYTRDSATIGAWTRASGGSIVGIAGSGTDASTLLFPRYSDNFLKYRINHGGSASNGGTISDAYGLTAASRSGANATQAYKNGAPSGAAGSVASAAPTSVQYNLGRTNSTFTANQSSVAFTGSNLSSSEHTSLYNALNTYLTAIGYGPLITSTNTLATTSAVVVADGASGSTIGKGWTVTGLARNPADGTWWVGNHGKALSNSPTYEASVVHLSSDFSTIIAEYTTAALGVSANSVQGVAYDSSDDTIWFIVLGSPGQIVHITGTGALITASAAPSGGLNGLAYDSTRDQLIGLAGNMYVNWYNKSDLSVVAGHSFRSTVVGDQLSYDASTDTVFLTDDGDGNNGIVQSWPVQDNEYGGLWNSRTDTLTGSDAMEGVVMYNNTYYIANDGYFHQGDPPLNRILVYPR